MFLPSPRLNFDVGPRKVVHHHLRRLYTLFSDRIDEGPRVDTLFESVNGSFKPQEQRDQGRQDGSAQRDAVASPRDWMRLPVVSRDFILSSPLPFFTDCLQFFLNCQLSASSCLRLL